MTNTCHIQSVGPDEAHAVLGDAASVGAFIEQPLEIEGPVGLVVLFGDELTNAMAKVPAGAALPTGRTA